MSISANAIRAVDSCLRGAIREAEVNLEFDVNADWRHELVEELHRIRDEWRASLPPPNICLDCVTPPNRCPLTAVTLAHDVPVTQCGEFDGAKGNDG